MLRRRMHLRRRAGVRRSSGGTESWRAPRSRATWGLSARGDQANFISLHATMDTYATSAVTARICERGEPHGARAFVVDPDRNNIEALKCRLKAQAQTNAIRCSGAWPATPGGMVAPASAPERWGTLDE